MWDGPSPRESGKVAILQWLKYKNKNYKCNLSDLELFFLYSKIK